MLNSTEHVISTSVGILTFMSMIDFTCWHFNIYEHDTFHGQMNAKNGFIHVTSGPDYRFQKANNC